MDINRYVVWQEKLQSQKWYRRFWVFFGIYSIAGVFVAGAYLLTIGQWKVVVIAFAAFVIARLIFAPIITLFYKKPRPYQSLKFSTVYSRLFSPQQIINNSFPSGHAVSFAAISYIFFWYFPVLGFIMCALTLLASCSRVVLGYHDEWDVLGGWMVGSFSAIVTLVFIAPILIK